MKTMNVVSSVVLSAVLAMATVSADDDAQKTEANVQTTSEVQLVDPNEVAQVIDAVDGDSNEGDTKDAEANREVSDTSIAIFSQNPYIQSIMEATTHIQVSRLKELLERGDEITMLDVRPHSEYAKNNGIEGTSLNIPRNFLEVEAYEKLPNKEAAIIIISSKGIRGGLAANTLQEMGYTNVRNLLGGLEGWDKAE